MGDSELEILHGGVGGDTEQGSRTTKHILAFAFDPLSLTLSIYICAKHHSFIHIIHILFACVVPCIIYIALSYMLGCLCVPHLYIAPQPISRGIKRS